MQAQEIYEKLKAEFGDAILELNEEAPSDPYIKIAPEKVLEISMKLRDGQDFMFDYMMCLSGLDCGAELCVVYHLYSMKFGHKIVVKAFVPKDDPRISTVERVWRTADWHEREAWDMLGIIFEGHHNLIRILTPYDWEGYPLRKDYVEPEVYHGMKVGY